MRYGQIPALHIWRAKACSNSNELPYYHIIFVYSRVRHLPLAPFSFALAPSWALSSLNPRVENKACIDEHLLVVLIEFEAVHGFLEALDLRPIEGIRVGVFGIDIRSGGKLWDACTALRNCNKISRGRLSYRLLS